MLFKRHRSKLAANHIMLIELYTLFSPTNRCFVRILGRPLVGARRVFLNERCSGAGRPMVPAHEIMHAMGRHHEQNRRDRNRFVRVNKNTCEEISYSCKNKILI